MSKNEERTVIHGVEVDKLSRINDLTDSFRIILCDERYPIIDNRRQQLWTAEYLGMLSAVAWR